MVKSGLPPTLPCFILIFLMFCYQSSGWDLARRGAVFCYQSSGWYLARRGAVFCYQWFGWDIAQWGGRDLAQQVVSKVKTVNGRTALGQSHTPESGKGSVDYMHIISAWRFYTRTNAETPTFWACAMHHMQLVASLDTTDGGRQCLHRQKNALSETHVNGNNNNDCTLIYVVWSCHYTLPTDTVPHIWLSIDFSLTYRWQLLIVHWRFIDVPLTRHWLSIDISLIHHWFSIDHKLTPHWPIIALQLIPHWPTVDLPWIGLHDGHFYPCRLNHSRLLPAQTL